MIITSNCVAGGRDFPDTTLIPHSSPVLCPAARELRNPDGRSGPEEAVRVTMATREKRLAQFDGSGEPPPEQPVEVLCEDHSGTYQLPFACRFIDGRWHNDESGGAVEATVIAWRMPRVKQAGAA
jgi:hypothetical protein